MKKIYLTSVVLIFTLLSCGEEFLDRQPLDQVVSSNFYQSESDAMEALVSVYDAFGYQSSPGVAWAPFVTVSDILSDHSYAGGADANDGEPQNQLNQFKIQTNNPIVHSVWLKNYTGIYRANLLLEKIDEIEASNDFKARIIAECKFLRAYFYLELVRFYENIPLLTETIKGPSEYSQTQNSPEEVYNQIATDLVEAGAVLPDMIPDSESGRVSKWAAHALLARTYLFYNGVYGGDLTAGSELVNQSYVLARLEEIISDSSHELMEDYSQIFKLAGELSSENVLEIIHGDSPAWWDWGYLRGGEGNLAAQMQGPRVTGSTNWNRGWSFAPVSAKLADVLEGDPRFEATILTENELDGNLVKGWQHTGFFSKKYSSDAEHWGSDGQFEHNRTCNFRVIRYSDVLLMAAELGSPNAQDYLDQVRARVGLPSVPATLENILHERQLEFALEGIRYFDVLRQGQAAAAEILSQQGERGENYIGEQVLFDIQFNNTSGGLLPIPQTEVDLSGGGFVQNPGY